MKHLSNLSHLPNPVPFLLAVLLLAGGGVSAHADTQVPITVVGFAGKVTLVGPDGKAVAATKNTVLPVGSTVTTGPNSWIDLAQGEISRIRVLPKTQFFTISQSSRDPKTNLSNSQFKLKYGSVVATAKPGAITKGSKYQIQTPEMIAGVVGSSLQLTHGLRGTTAIKITGTITLNINGRVGEAPSGQATVVLPNGTTQTVTLTPAVQQMLQNIASSVQSSTPPTQQQLQQQLNDLTNALNQILGAAGLPLLDTITSATQSNPEQNPYGN